MNYPPQGQFYDDGRYYPPPNYPPPGWNPQQSGGYYPPQGAPQGPGINKTREEEEEDAVL
ncbi:hypothetical protein FRB90_003146, partial [Tulasnella sp. 427]